MLDLAANERIGASPFAGIEHASLHLLTARRHLVQHRDVDVPPDRELQRAGDRRRGHHQQVRIVTLLTQRCTLLNTEAVLLVNHGEPKTAEGHRRLDQRVGADDRMQRAIGKTAHHLLTVGPRRAPRQQSHRKARLRERCEELAQSAIVLLCQDLRRRHQSDLVAGVDDQRHQQRRDHRLARPDVALQQAVHRVARGQILQHLIQRALLRLGHLIGQSRLERLNPCRIYRDLVARLCLPHRLLPQQPELQIERLLERDTPPRRTQVLVTVGQVNTPQRPPQRDQAMGCQQGLRQCITHPPGPCGQRAAHRTAHPPLGQTLRQRIDGLDARIGHVGPSDDLPLGCHHRQTPQILIDFSADQQLHPRSQATLEESLVEPGDLQCTRGVRENRAEDVAIPVGRPPARFPHRRQ